MTLSDVHTVKPTFTVLPVTGPSGDSYQFSLTVNNGYLSNAASTTVSSVASTPTVAAPTKTRVGGGTTFTVGDLRDVERRDYEP